MDSMEQCRPRAEANTIVITAWNGGYLPQFLAAWVNGSVSNASNINQVGLQCFSVMQQLTERKTARPNQTIQWLEISQGLTGRWQKGFLFFFMCFFLILFFSYSFNPDEKGGRVGAINCEIEWIKCDDRRQFCLLHVSFFLSLAGLSWRSNGT